MIEIYDKPFKQDFSKQDVAEFTATAQHFNEHKTYTREPVKSKKWYDFWREERRRCIEGYNIGRDYITGYHYFYLNFSRILKSKVVKENEEGQNQAERIEAFPDFWDGDYDFFHYLDEAEKSGQHAMLLGSRGKGKSLKTGSMLVRNYEHFRNSKNYAYAYSEEFLTNDGIISKAWYMMDFISNNTPWAKSRDEENSGLHRKASKKVLNNGVWTTHPRSYNSEIMGVVVGDRLDKARGKRGKLIIYEEIGMFKKSNRAWNMNRPSMEDGKNTFGLMLAIGTGGTEGSNFEGAEDMAKNPEAYKIYPIRNRWDEGKENTKICYFWSAAVNYGGCYNEETGVSDIAKALKEIDKDRKIIANSGDNTALIRRKAELPLTVNEVLMRISHSIFPKEELLLQEAEIENNEYKYKNADFIGRLKLNKDTQQYEFINTNDTPIYKLYTTNKNMPGAIIIYEHPKKDNSGNNFYNRYWAGIDSYDHDESTTTSLGSIYIGDSWTRKIVAHYTGRPKTAEEFYEICRRLLIYYNAKANIENHNKGIFTYFKQKNSEYLISDEPSVVRETLSDVTLRKTGLRRKLGTTPSVPVQQYARGLLAKWLLESTDNPDKPEELRVHLFRDIAAIREMLAWNSEGNFDRIDALIMLMLIWEENIAKEADLEATNKKLAHDKFFIKTFNKYKPVIKKL